MTKSIDVFGKILPAMLFAIAIANDASAQDEAVDAAKDQISFGSWDVVCAEEKNCQAFINLVSKETNELALTASFHFVDGAAAATGVVVLPLGVALRPGVRISTPGNDDETVNDPIELTPEVCFPDGCRVVFNLDENSMAQILSADSFNILFFAYSREGDRPISMTLPTDGLDQAFEYMAGK